MRSFDVGVARLPLKEVTAVVQIGDDLTVTKSVVILVQGIKTDDSRACFCISIKLKEKFDDQF